MYAYPVKAVDRPRVIRKVKPLFHLYPHKPNQNLALKPPMDTRSRGYWVEPEINLLKLLPWRSWWDFRQSKP